MKITRLSALSGQYNTREIPVTQAQLDAWRGGHALIQDALPQLSQADREFLITGTTPEEWDAAFPEEDPEQADDVGTGGA